MNDTIAAIATAPGMGGISVVRVSGPQALRVAQGAFMPAKRRSAPRPRVLEYGHVACADGQAGDEALGVFFPAPHSYTGEDVFELQCHGGAAAASLALEACLRAGARAAEPGEFTKRAFLSGRIDLTQAEAVMRIVSARSERAARQAQRQLGGSLGRAIGALQERLLDMLARIGAAADYPEDDIEQDAARQVQGQCRALLAELEALIEGARGAMRVSDGVRVVLAGRPNAGKSSLLNALCGRDAAIVTAVPGTTRDVLSEQVVMGGVPVTLCDTAGLRDAPGEVERIGVARARSEIASADVVLLVCACGEALDEADRDVLAVQGKPVALVRSKDDIAPGGADERPQGVPVIEVSALTGDGLERVRRFIVEAAGAAEALGETALTEQRHVEAARAAAEALRRVIGAVDAGMPVDVCAVDIQDAWERLGQITGQTATDRIITRIFESFCLGK